MLIFSPGLQSQGLFNGYEHLFTPPPQYTVYRVPGKIVIDGHINDKAWQKAEWSKKFIDIEGDKKPLPLHDTRFKMLWDENYLYICAELIEPHVWGTLKNHDDIIYRDNDFEVFIDPDNDTHHYFEIEINALNTIMDLYMSRPYRDSALLLMDWNAKGMLSAIQVDGTLNDPSGTDRKWTVEMAIPFSALQANGYHTQTPSDSTLWRMGFSRVQWHTEIKNNQYHKILNPQTSKPLSEENWTWTSQGVINMHFPERWGYVFFSREKAGERTVAFNIPPSEELKKYLWLIYYKQAAYKREHKVYASALKELDMPESITHVNGQLIVLNLHSYDNGFKAGITSGKENWQIDHKGLVKAAGELQK